MRPSGRTLPGGLMPVTNECHYLDFALQRRQDSVKIRQRNVGGVGGAPGTFVQRIRAGFHPAVTAGISLW